MDKTTKTVVIFLLIIGSLSLISNSVWKPFIKKESLKISDAQLQNVVNEINEMVPIFLDDITQLNSVQLEDMQLNEYCNSNENSYFSKVGVAVTSNYLAHNGERLHSFTMRPSDCVGS